MAAEITKRNWERRNEAEFWRVYLQGPCVVWLLKYLKMGNKTLLRTGTRGKDTHPNELELRSVVIQFLSPIQSEREVYFSW